MNVTDGQTFKDITNNLLMTNRFNLLKGEWKDGVTYGVSCSSSSYSISRVKVKVE